MPSPLMSSSLSRVRVSLVFGEPVPWSLLSGIPLRGAWGTRIHDYPVARDALFKSGLPQPILFVPVLTDAVQDLEATLTDFATDGPFSLHELHHHAAAHYVRHVAFDLVFVGESIRHAEFVLALVWETQEEGLGRSDFRRGGRIPFRIVSLSHLDRFGVETLLAEADRRTGRIERADLELSECPPTFTYREAVTRAESLSGGSHLRIEFQTPTLLVREEDSGHKRELRRPRFDDVLWYSRSRMKTLAHFYAPPAEGAESWPELPADAGEWESVYWTDRPVSSRSQMGRDRIKGVIGRLVAPMPSDEWLELLAFVEQVHLGKNAISGMGRVRLTALRK